MTAPATHADSLPRRLGVWSAAAFVVGDIIGSGIFRVPASVAADTGTAWAMALVWIVGGVVALLGVLALAELSTLFPRAGGLYVYLAKAYGRLPAFLFGWTTLFLTPVSLAALALVFAEYLGTFVPLSNVQTRAAACGVLALLTVANYRSTSWSAALQGVATIAKVSGLLALAFIAFVFGPHGGAQSSPVPPSAGSWGQFTLALIAVLWAYNGWQDLAALGGEIRDPARNVPRALIGGILVVIAIYLLVNAAYLSVMPIDAMANSPLVAADVMNLSIGSRGSALVSMLVMVSTFGALNAVVASQPRIFFAMAEDGAFFRSIAAVHPRFRTPHVAIAFSALLGFLFISVRTFEQLTEAFVVGVWPFLALMVWAVIVLRRRHPELPRPYRTPGTPVLQIVFVAASLALMITALVQHPVSTLIGLGITLLGVPVFFVWQARARRLKSQAAAAT